ncbi:MAG: hypothetical protein SNJ75_14215 [Gemmataceae bacterium]
MRTVHLRFQDASVVLPVRLRLVVHDQPLWPLGRFPDDHESTHETPEGLFAYVDGPCELRLPPGPFRLSAFAGPLFVPLHQQQHLAAGQLALRFGMQRLFNPRQRGWYAGDLRVHGLTPHGALLQARAEDLDLVQLLQRPGESLVAFSGQEAAVVRGTTWVAVNTLNVDPRGGTLSLLHAHRPVFPQSTDEQPWSLHDWCDQCHRKRGLVVWPDTPRLTAQAPAQAALQAAVRGQIDALEVCTESAVELYHELLQAGIRLALVGSSGRTHRAQRLGQVRTYAQLLPQQEFSLSAFIEAIRAGRSIASSGPLVELRKRCSEWEAEVFPEQSVELLHNAEVVASGIGRVQIPCPANPSGWIAARTHGPYGWAHSSAVWLDGPYLPRYSERLSVLGVAKHF